MHEIDDGVLALTAGPDGAIYVGCWTAVFKVKKDASVTTIASRVKVTDCDFDPADHKARIEGRYFGELRSIRRELSTRPPQVAIV